MNYKIIEVQYKRNIEGQKYEKIGKIDEAIKLYEMNVNEMCEGNFPYDRLSIIYHKMKRYDDEKRILNKAISVFEKIDIRRRDIQPKLKSFKERLSKL